MRRASEIASGPTQALRRASVAWQQPIRDGPGQALRRASQVQQQPYLWETKTSTDLPVTSTDGHDDEKTAKCWIRLGDWLHKLYYLKRMIVGFDLIWVSIAACIVTYVVNKFGLIFLADSKPAIATLGALYAFALVFRTNICYSRWWEGRELWGALIVCTIRLAQQAHLWMKEPSLVERLSCLSILFAYCCKAQLKGRGIEDPEEGGAKLLAKGVVSKEELDLISSQSGWQPYYCIDAMRVTMCEGLQAADRKEEWKMNAAQLAMEETIWDLSKCIGGCIRVRSTGLPVAYDDILNAVGTIFFTVACLAWAPDAGWYNPVVILFAYIVAKMIIGVGSHLEDPFGDDESDLPLERFCAEIDKQITAVDDRSRIITFDMAYGPAGFSPSNRASSYRATPNHTNGTNVGRRSYVSRQSIPSPQDNDIESGQMPMVEEADEDSGEEWSENGGSPSG